MSNTIHIGIFIDGTGNHRSNDERIGNGTQSNVAKLDKVFEETPGNEEYHIYVPGVGTRSFEELGFIDKEGKESQEIRDIRAGKIEVSSFYDAIAMGSGRNIMGRGVKSQVNEALDEITLRVNEIHQTNPDTQIELDIVSFSRGAASGRDLSNELRKQGILNDNVEINVLGMFDTVSSINLADGDNKDINVDLDKNSAKHIIHYTAEDEIRENYRLESIPGIDKPYHGAHADIGGAYGILDNKEACIQEGSRRSTTVNNNEINTKIHELQRDADAKGYGLYYNVSTNSITSQSVISSAYVEEKNIEFGLSTVTLNDMYTEMKEYGVPMTDLSVLGHVKNNDAYSNWEVPQALQKNPQDERYIHTSYIGEDRVFSVDDHYERPSPFVILAHSPEESNQRSIDINNPANAIHEMTPEEFSKSVDSSYAVQQDSMTTTRPEEAYYESGLSIELSNSIEQSEYQSNETIPVYEDIANQTYNSQYDSSMDNGMEIDY
jgi:hypothetical protein